MYRNIIEMSGMKNNDERVFFTEEKVEDIKEIRIVKRSSFLDCPSLVLSREVLPQEIEQGLDTSFNGSSYKEDPPEITAVRDDFVKLKQDLDFHMTHFDMSIENAISECLANTFYSPMSSGCGRYYLSACRYFIEQHDLDMSTEVYPSYTSDNWDTFTEFFKEIERIPRIEETVLKLGTDLKKLSE